MQKAQARLLQAFLDYKVENTVLTMLGSLRD